MVKCYKLFPMNPFFFILICVNIRDFTYYKMNNLDNRISNPDQLLTTDVERFCSSITELYSNVSKPMLDIVIYVQRLATTIGGQVHLPFQNEKIVD